MENVYTKEAGINGEVTTHPVHDFPYKGCWKGECKPENNEASKYAIKQKECNPMLTSSRESPLFFLTTAYRIPGSMDALVQAFPPQSVDEILLNAQIAYYRGKLEDMFDLIAKCKTQYLTIYQHITIGIFESLYALEHRNYALWEETRNFIMQYHYHNEKEKELLLFWQAIIDSFLYDNSNLPTWFQQGCFDQVPVDSHPSVRYFYVRCLFISSRKALPNAKSESHEYNVLMKCLAATCEPLISQTRIEGIILAEIYLRLICAIAYHNYGEDDKAITHLDIAIQLAMPDRLFRPFVEYQINLDSLLDQAFKKVDKGILSEIKNQFKKFAEGWISIHNKKLNKTMSLDLSFREREVARLAVNGLSNVEIAKRLGISVNTVKHTLQHAMEKTGCEKRNDLFYFI